MSRQSSIQFFFTPISCVALSLMLLTSCSKAPELTKISGPAQGTTYNLTFELPANTNVAVADIQKAVTDEFSRIDKALSNYRDDSAIEEFNAQKTTEVLSVDAELVALIEEARKIYRASNGCYDLTIKPLFDLWGFKKDQFSPPTEEALTQTLVSVGMDKLETIDATHLRKQIPELRVDISSIGQGYSVGRIVKVLEQFGVQNYLVEIGGELQTKGKKPNGDAWRIAVEKPLPNERKLHKIASFDSGVPMALMTSGTYRHFFDSNGKRYSHILDARNGKPVEHNTVSVTLFHENPTIADAWSTALLCLGSNEGLKAANANNLAVLFIDQQGDELIEHESNAMKTFNDVSLKLP
ncbi:MAG TPA: FAD:protein FMN transferase [Cellvibrio sp.]|nr:FAD:protein FMN transferase [Cellvibrio sp.]